MRGYILRRFLYMLLLMFMGSIVSFAVITLPPGDYLTAYVMDLKARGSDISAEMEEALRHQYGLDYPVYVQYFRWLGRVLRGDLGMSFAWNKPVSELIGERIGMTVLISFAALIFTYLVAIPIGIYSAVRQYSAGDYLFTFMTFIGVSIPNFLLALVLMMFFSKTFGLNVGGLFSKEYTQAAWSWGKLVDLLKHLPVPLLVISLSGTAWLTRTMRAMLLDELRRPYVQTARAKGLKENKLLWKYPIRVAVLPIASTVGWALPGIFSGSTIVAIVLDLPTIGPLLFKSLTTQDMFLAASTVLISTALTLIGTFISDIFIAWLDPRIQYT
jgi:peptide/nickel transport system permease protein